MMTYEMIGVADQNGRTYESEFGTYNKKDKFVLSNYSNSLTIEDLLDKLLHENCWVLRKDIPKPKKMTIKEIENALGYKIDIEKENEDINESDKNIDNDTKIPNRHSNAISTSDLLTELLCKALYADY